MMQTTCKVVNYCVYRHFSVSNAMNKAFVKKEHSFLRKILQKDDAKCGRRVDPFAIPLLTPGNPSKIRHQQSQRRISALNKVISGYITDLISTGDAAPGLLEKQVEIHDIQVASTANIIRIYWSHDGMDIDSVAKELEEMMVKAGQELRNKLSQLNVMGMVPPVVFMKYKYAMAEKEIDRRLKIADYGPDYESQTYKHLGTKTVTDKPTCENDEENVNEGDDSFCITLPTMQHCIMGVDHYKIMSKIKVALERSSKIANERKLRAENAHQTHATSECSADYNEILEQQHKHQQQFLNYVKKLKTDRKIQRKPSKRWQRYTEFAEPAGAECAEFEDEQDDNIIEEDTLFYDDPEKQ